MTTVVYAVNGMSCVHCVNAVSAELAKLGGVRHIAVDLDAGQVAVTSDHLLDAELVRAAIDEAGYELAAALRKLVTYTLQCPRCGREFEGQDRDTVADAVVEHARVEHRHALDRDVVLTHLDGVHPHE